MGIVVTVSVTFKLTTEPLTGSVNETQALAVTVNWPFVVGVVVESVTREAF
jgi:hypothetical protein